MTQQFKLPDLGEGIHQSEVLEIPVSVGDEVNEDDIILTLETDKAAVDIPSPFTGTIEEIHVETGDIVNVGDVMLTVSNVGDSQEMDETESKNADKAQAKAEVQGNEDKQESQANKQKEQTKDQTDKVEQKKRDESTNKRPVPAAPATRRLARELDVELRQVEGSGPGGRVTADDVRAYSEGNQTDTQESQQPDESQTTEQESKKVSGQKKRTSPTELPDFNKWGETERITLRSIRRTTAQHMTQSWENIPHVTHHDRADVTELETLRQQYQEGMGLENLTLTAFVMKAVIAALKKYPRFNASLDVEENEMIIKHYYNIGLAVDTERGLIVPVIKDVDSKNLMELAGEIETIARRAREGEITLEEMQGGTFTITNVGPIGGTHFNPIINFPQAAILGIAKIDWKPIVMEDKSIEPRLMMPLVLAFDHRLADGAEAARMMNDVIGMLEDPDRFMLRL